MESKFLVLLAIASLAQGSYVPTLTVDYGLLENEVAVLNEIIVNQDRTEQIYENGLGAYFNVLSEATNQSDLSSQTFEALSGLGTGFLLTFDTIHTATVESCPTVAAALNVSYPLLQDIISEIAAASKAAQSTYSSEVLEEINFRHVIVTVKFESVFTYLFYAVENCATFTDSELSDVVEEAENGAKLKINALGDAIFGAIKALAVAGSGSAAATEIEDFEDTAITRIRNTIEYIYGLYKTVYAYPRLNQTGILSRFATNQYALTYSYNRYKEAYEVLFKAVTDYSQRLYEGYYENVDISFADSLTGIMDIVAKFIEAGTSTLDTLPVFDPNDQAEIDEIRADLDDASYAADLAFLLAIQSAVEQAGKDFASTLAEIDGHRFDAVDPVEESTTVIFVLVANNKSWGNTTDSQLATLLVQSIFGAELASDKFFDAIEVLAKHVHDNYVNYDDFAVYEGYLDTAFYGVANLLQTVSAAGVSVYRAYANSS